MKLHLNKINEMLSVLDKLKEGYVAREKAIDDAANIEKSTCDSFSFRANGYYYTKAQMEAIFQYKMDSANGEIENLERDLHNIWYDNNPKI